MEATPDDGVAAGELDTKEIEFLSKDKAGDVVAAASLLLLDRELL
jgi:hypothetical protein